MEDERELDLAAQARGVSREEVSGLSELKKGMTNHSFLFSVKGKNILCVSRERGRIN